MLPPTVFVTLAALVWYRIGDGDPSRIQSALIGHPAPPETFIVGRDGKIAYKLVGPITPDNIGSAQKAKIDKAVNAVSSTRNAC